jgi:predicted lipoprotein with Yx(FWY)xxD motif
LAIAPTLAAVFVLGTTTAFAATSTPSGHAPVRAKPTVSIARTYVGPLLVDKSGDTIYMFVRDKRNKDVCITIKGCEKDWPAVTTVGKPVAGPGVKKSLLGTIPYQGKLRELTYKGHPLHTYIHDHGKGDVLNIGNHQFHGSWFALNANGGEVK